MQTNMPIIFIGGQRKAGTSMFLNLFDGHPDLLVYPIDITIFYAYYPEYIKSSYSDKQRLARLKRVIFDELREYENVNSTLNIDKFSSIFFNKINGHDLKNIGITIYTISGVLIMEDVLNQESQIIDIKKLPKGCYIVKLSNGINYDAYQKIIKQ